MHSNSGGAVQTQDAVDGRKNLDGIAARRERAKGKAPLRDHDPGCSLPWRCMVGTEQAGFLGSVQRQGGKTRVRVREGRGGGQEVAGSGRVRGPGRIHVMMMMMAGDPDHSAGGAGSVRGQRTAAAAAAAAVAVAEVHLGPGRLAPSQGT